MTGANPGTFRLPPRLPEVVLTERTVGAHAGRAIGLPWICGR